jgi:hypothetical protein
MLASITPLGERGRNATWTVTVTAFLLGATAAGAGAGAALGAAGSFALPGSFEGPERLFTLAGLALIALALDMRSAPVPGPRRQVNERWLDEYRGWVYGLGYGAQLGLGVTTIVSSAATYVAVVAAFLTADVGKGAIVLGCFGAIRGLTPLAAARVRRPEQLMSFHARLGRLRRPAERVALAALAAIGGAAVVWGLA